MSTVICTQVDLLYFILLRTYICGKCGKIARGSSIIVLLYSLGSEFDSSICILYAQCTLRVYSGPLRRDIYFSVYLSSAH